MSPHARAAVIAALAASALLPRPARADTIVGEAAGVLQINTVASGLDVPSDFRFLPDGRIVITQLDGHVLLRNLDGGLVEAGFIAAVQPQKNSEMGLFSVEVHPDFATNGLLYFYYARSDEAGGSDLDRDRLVTIPLLPDGTLDMAAEVVLVDQIQGPWNHHGGGLGVGPDRKLYLAVGDTGCLSGKPPEPVSTPSNFFPTCLTNPQGKLLRLELDGSIPADNPLVGVEAVTSCGATCDVDTATTGLAPPARAIFAWGFRNPFRLWIDPLTGLPWVGDVGELSYEEIDVVHAGRHYGWPWREGAHGWPAAQCGSTTPGADCVDPVYECQHGGTGTDSGCVAISGGAIVDGCSWPESWRGRYFFADSGTGTIASLEPAPDRAGIVPGSRKDVAVMRMPVSVRPGPEGDLYVLDLYGRLAAISPVTRVPCAAPAIETGATASLEPVDPTLVTSEPTATAPEAVAADGGCGCQTGASEPRALALLPLLAFALRRRRRG